MRKRVGTTTYAAWAGLAWLALMAVAVIDGALRMHVLLPKLGSFAAFALSGALMIAATAIAAWALAERVEAPEEQHTWAVGFFWVIGAILFEALIVRLVRGESIASLIENYSVAKVLEGELIIPGLVFMGFAPWLFDRAAGARESDAGDG